MPQGKLEKVENGGIKDRKPGRGKKVEVEKRVGRGSRRVGGNLVETVVWR